MSGDVLTPTFQRQRHVTDRCAWAVRSIQCASADFAVAISDADTVAEAEVVYKAAREMEQLLTAQVTAISLKLNQLGSKS